jgi:uncharacterized membrane protein YeaQ/YmgE (transglycosylase-associated protein family)
MPPSFGIEVTPSLGQFIGALYQYSLGLVGLAVFGMFLYAGIKMMFGDRSGAIKIIQDAVIGALILLSAYVILNTINPDYVKFTPSGPFPDLSPEQQ